MSLAGIPACRARAGRLYLMKSSTFRRGLPLTFTQRRHCFDGILPSWGDFNTALPTCSGLRAGRARLWLGEVTSIKAHLPHTDFHMDLCSPQLCTLESSRYLT